jgi:hypothetical protein
VTYGGFDGTAEDAMSGDDTIVDDFDADPGTDDIDAVDEDEGLADVDDTSAADAVIDADADDDGSLDDGADDAYGDGDAAAKARLAAALAEIDARFGRPPSEQVEAFAQAHLTLQATLNRIDTT